MLESPNNAKLTHYLVPLSTFEKGNVGKIFNEVRRTGLKVVVSDNNPICILLSPDYYDQMVELIEDYELYIEAERRLSNSNTIRWISQEEIMSNFGITQNDLDNTDVEIF